jgi:hypothetical protein
MLAGVVVAPLPKPEDPAEVPPENPLPVELLEDPELPDEVLEVKPPPQPEVKKSKTEIKPVEIAMWR